MSNDPRGNIKNLLVGITATLDDDATPAQIMIVYTGSPENYKQWFYIYDYDAVITIDPPIMRESGNMRRIQWRPIRYESDVGVHVSAVDKATVTATKLLNKIGVSMENALGAPASTYTYNTILQSSRPRIVPMGGYDPIWITDYVIHYRPLYGAS